MMYRNLIFDWSGTLCDDLALTIEATNYVLAQYGREPLTAEAFRNEFQLPYPGYYAWKTPEAKLEDLENLYRKAFDASATGVTLLPHARDFIRFCADSGIRCFILTSMDPKAFESQARALGLYPYFEHIHSGIHNKEEHIPLLMQQHGLRPEDTAFIGDMQHDIDAAHRVGITGIGVLTGYNNAQQLSASRPDFIVPDLAALQQIMQRAAAAPEPDSVGINALEFSCCIGVTDEELSAPQRLSADISFVPPCSLAAMEDDIEKTIDYEALAHKLVESAQQQPVCLLETLAHRMARSIVEDFGARSARVELHKFILPDAASSSVRASYPSR